MSFGICLTVYNHLHFGNRIYVWLESLPQFLFMQSIFGYLCVCIMYKWSIDWSLKDPDTGLPLRNSPPGLLNMLIFMFLQPGTINKGEELYSGQAGVQMFLLTLALLCVPWMLFGKPFWEKYQWEKRQREGYSTLDQDENSGHQVYSCN